MTALMEDSGVAQVFAVLRARSMSLSDHDRDAYLVTLAEEEAGMHEAFATKGAADLWSPSSQPSRLPARVLELDADEGEPRVAKVWDITALPPRLSVVREAVAALCDARPVWASSA